MKGDSELHLHIILGILSLNSYSHDKHSHTFSSGIFSYYEKSSKYKSLLQ